MALQEIDGASREAASKASLATIEALANRIASEPELFAQGDAALSSQSLEATKRLFDLALSTEFRAFPAVSDTLESLFSGQEGPSAATRGKRKREGDIDGSAQADKTLKVEPTPLGELTVSGMDTDQVWQQLEMRAGRICEVLDKVITSEGGSPPEDEDEEEIDKNGEEEEKDDDLGAMPKQKIVHSLRELSDADLRAMGLDPERRAEIEKDFAEMDDDDDEGDEEEEEEEEDGPEPYAGTSDLSDEEEAGIVTLEPLLSEEEQQRRKQEAERRELMQLRSHKRLAKMMMGRDPDEDSEEEEEQEDEGIDPELAQYMHQSIAEEDEEGDDEEEDEEDEEEDDEATAEHKRRIGILDNLDAPGSSSQKAAHGSERRHPTLDDDFFSIDQFNRDTDDYGDEGVDLGDDVDLFATVDGQPGEGEDEEEGEDDQIMYVDFFAPPAVKRGPRQQDKGKGKAASKLVAEQGEAPRSKVGDTNAPAALSMARGDHAKTQEVAAREDTAGEPRKRVLRFHDQVAVRRIKARKKRDEMAITPELLRAMQQGKLPDQVDEGEEESASSDEGFEEQDEEAEDEVHSGEEEEEPEEEEDDEDVEDDEGLDEEMAEVGEDEEDEEMSEQDAAEEEQEIAHRVAGDLFADDEPEKGPAKESSHERKMRGLQEEIARLERENVDRKDWTLMGEAGAKSRPENSLLEQDLEFENTAKVKPVVTEETTSSLEDMIKQRILEGRFDDVQRRLNIEAMPFLPSRMLELSDQKSGKSLAEIYEDQYEDQKATENGQVQTPEQDRKLEEEHREIDELFDDINNKLDALTNAHFTPRAPKASIQTLSNAPAITMESSLPATSSGRSMLAPEEVYDAGRHNVSLTGDRSEMTPGEKQRMQRKLRADKAARNSRIEDARRKIEINRAAVGAGPGGPKGRKAEEREKEEALKRLMGNKGVSVVGKGNEDKRAKGKGKAGAPPVNAASLRL